MEIKPIPEELMQEGDEDGIALVEVREGRPHCIYHGAMNKLPYHNLWRCFAEYGYKDLPGETMPKFIDRTCPACCVEDNSMICGKCKTKQDMVKRIIGKEFCWWCPNCKDQIADSACTKANQNNGKKS